VDYYLFRPSPAPASDQELAVLLTDKAFPDVAHTFEATSGGEIRFIPIDVTVSLKHFAVEPFEAGSGFCHDTLAGSTLVGYLEASILLSEPAPLFIQAEYNDASVGPVRQFASTIPTRGEIVPVDQLDLQLPLTAAADGCALFTLFDWTLNPLWSHRFCLSPDESLSLDARFEYRSANLPHTPHIPPPAPTQHDTTRHGLRPLSP
jgi:hypothetical protein